MRTTPLNRPTLVTVTGLATGAVGLLIQKVAGVEMPAVPPGLIILTVVAVLIAVTRWRWTLVLAAVAALAEIPGFVGSAVDADEFGEVAGAAVRGAGATAALVAGITAAAIAYRSRKPAPESAGR
ncbi:hypothetical protein [Actinomadura sp. GTD37]|uniref:hypothetical protein n=1 Tax=Actinomadura sp. GTD37 TaxID=1778030 RepID=UPI0035C1BD26